MWFVHVNHKKVFESEDKETAEEVLKILKNITSDSDNIIHFALTTRDAPIHGKLYKKIMKAVKEFTMGLIDEEIGDLLKDLPNPLNPRVYGKTEPSIEPPKNVVKNLLAASRARDFERAKREWEFRGEIIEETSPDFSNCQLCGQANLETNCIIHNIYNGNSLKVGNICVRRFLIINQSSSIEESQDLFDAIYNRSVYIKMLQRLIPSLADEVISESTLLKLIDTCKSYFGETFDEGKFKELISILNVGGTHIEKILYCIATDDLKSLRHLVKVKQLKDKVPNYWGKMRARVTTTLSHSGAYRV